MDFKDVSKSVTSDIEDLIEKKVFNRVCEQLGRNDLKVDIDMDNYRSIVLNNVFKQYQQLYIDYIEKIKDEWNKLQKGGTT